MCGRHFKSSVSKRERFEGDFSSSLACRRSFSCLQSKKDGRRNKSSLLYTKDSMKWYNKKILIWGWVILVIPIVCRSQWMRLSVIYIFTILMLLTHPQWYRLSSSPAVMILIKATTSCTKHLDTMLWGDTRSLSTALRARICGIQYQNASCNQIVNFTPSWSTYYICYILHGFLVFIFLLMIKLFLPKVGMYIRW